jgi:Ca-activated chloride channel family protein
MSRWPLEFREPWFLLLALAALPVLWSARRRGGTLLFSSVALLPRHTGSLRSRLAFLPELALALATLGLAVAMAGPRVGDRRHRVEREGIAIMMVVDVSGSMRALDLGLEERRTRLDVVKTVFEEFVLGKGDLPGRPSDTIGLVSFARYADTRCPLTLDHGNLALIARSLQLVESRDEDGTAIGDGLGLAIERLRESSARSRVVILLTDGVSNAGEETPLGAAELARALGVKVYTIGAGTSGVAPIAVQDPFTGREVLQAVPVEIDEATLRQIAERTGG